MQSTLFSALALALVVVGALNGQLVLAGGLALVLAVHALVTKRMKRLAGSTTGPRIYN